MYILHGFFSSHSPLLSTTFDDEKTISTLSHLKSVSWGRWSGHGQGLIMLTRMCALDCDFGPYGVSRKVQNHRPAHHISILKLESTLQLRRIAEQSIMLQSSWHSLKLIFTQTDIQSYAFSNCNLFMYYWYCCCCCYHYYDHYYYYYHHYHYCYYYCCWERGREIELVWCSLTMVVLANSGQFLALRTERTE